MAQDTVDLWLSSNLTPIFQFNAIFMIDWKYQVKSLSWVRE